MTEVRTRWYEYAVSRPGGGVRVIGGTITTKLSSAIRDANEFGGVVVRRVVPGGHWRLPREDEASDVEAEG